MISLLKDLISLNSEDLNARAILLQLCIATEEWELFTQIFESERRTIEKSESYKKHASYLNLVYRLHTSTEPESQVRTYVYAFLSSGLQEFFSDKKFQNYAENENYLANLRHCDTNAVVPNLKM